MIREKWSLNSEDIDNIFPVEKIIEILGNNPGIRVLIDEEVKRFNPGQYNISILARAYCESMDNLLYEYYESYHESPELSDKLNIHLPQIMWLDSLGYDNAVISLHITKLRKSEIYINDIILCKNNDLNRLGNGIFDIVLENLYSFARKKGIKYISGYAIDYKIYNIFKSKGFKEDKRKSMRNDILWEQSKITGQQIPFYRKI